MFRLWVGLIKIRIQKKINNYSRVDFRFKNSVSGEARFCVGLTKEDFGSDGVSLITAKSLYNVGGSTYFQIHNNWSATYVEDASLTWTIVADKNASNETICSIICSDYWEENLFGNGADLPTNFGHVDISPQSGVHQDWTPTQWALDDDDGNIILTVITNSWPLDNLIHYSKITKDGQYVDGSRK